LNQLVVNKSVTRGLQPALSLLPRKALQWIEMHTPPQETGEAKPFSVPLLRVALVKSEVTSHIYSRPGSSRDLRSLVLSSPKMLGPTALFSTFQTDFIIVRESRDQECQHWRESFQFDAEPEKSSAIYEGNRHLRPATGPEPRQTQGESAVPAESVDWDQFDAVICHDIAVPARIVCRHPRVFWSYWIGETGTASYKHSLRAPMAGYQCFLNGGSRAWKVRPSLRSHVLEFPYIFQKAADRFLLGASRDALRAGILLERVTSATAPAEPLQALERICPVKKTSETTADRLQKLYSARYFLQMTNQTFWGNGFQEAVMAGCLAIAAPRTMPNNRSLCLPELSPQTWPEAITLIRDLEENPGKRARLQHKQEARAEWLLFRRPLTDWLEKQSVFRFESNL